MDHRLGRLSEVDMGWGTAQIAVRVASGYRLPNHPLEVAARLAFLTVLAVVAGTHNVRPNVRRISLNRRVDVSEPAFVLASRAEDGRTVDVGDREVGRIELARFDGLIAGAELFVAGEPRASHGCTRVGLCAQPRRAHHVQRNRQRTSVPAHQRPPETMAARICETRIERANSADDPAEWRALSNEIEVVPRGAGDPRDAAFRLALVATEGGHDDEGKCAAGNEDDTGCVPDTGT